MRLNGLHELEEVGARSEFLGHTPVMDAAQCFVETIGLHRLQKVVDSVHFKSLHRKSIISCNENNRWQLVSQHRFENREAIQFRQLNVEQYKVRHFLLDHADGTLAVPAFSHYIDAGPTSQQSTKAFPR